MGTLLRKVELWQCQAGLVLRKVEYWQSGGHGRAGSLPILDIPQLERPPNCHNSIFLSILAGSDPVGDPPDYHNSKFLSTLGFRERQQALLPDVRRP